VKIFVWTVSIILRLIVAALAFVSSRPTTVSTLLEAEHGAASMLVMS